MSGADQKRTGEGVRLPRQLWELPDQELGLRIIDAFAERLTSWTHGRNSFPVPVIRTAWRDHVTRGFPCDLGDTRFHSQYLQVSYHPSDPDQSSGREAMLRRWLECFNAMLRVLNEPVGCSASGWSAALVGGWRNPDADD